MSTETDTGSAPTPAKKKFEFPGAVTMLAIVTVLVWIAALFIPAGRFGVDVDGSPVPGSFETVTSPLSFWERIQQLILSPSTASTASRIRSPGSSTPTTSDGSSVRSA